MDISVCRFLSFYVFLSLFLEETENDFKPKHSKITQIMRETFPVLRQWSPIQYLNSSFVFPFCYALVVCRWLR